MRNALCLAFAAAILVAIFSSRAAAVPTVVTSLRLTDTNGTPIPSVAGVYSLTPGGVFDVILSAQVNSPNLTDNFRGAATNGKPLGLQSLRVNLTTPGSVGIFTPVVDPSSPPSWLGYADLTPDAVAVPIVNLIDVDTDSDLDAQGAGLDVSA